MEQVFDPANLDVAIRVMALLLLAGGGFAVFELIRYLRTLRYGKELNQRLLLKRAQEEMGNDPRLVSPAPVPVRPGVFTRLAGRSIHTVGIVAILVVAFMAFAVPFLGPWLERQDELERAEVIVPLPGDTRRLVRAAELYKQGYAPRILLGRSAAEFDRIGAMQTDAGYPATDFADLQLRTLERAGVPRDSIELADMGDAGIAGVAGALQRQFEDRKVRVIVVTTGIQAMRTRVALDHALPRARVMVVSAPESGEPRSGSADSTVATLAEVSRLARDWFHGHNASSGPGAPQATTKPPENTGAGRETARP